MAEYEVHQYDVIVVGAGGAGATGGDGVRGPGCPHRSRVQVAARESPHRHGRGRDRCGPRERVLGGQLEGSLPATRCGAGSS